MGHREWALELQILFNAVGYLNYRQLPRMNKECRLASDQGLTDWSCTDSCNPWFYRLSRDN